ncbi:histidine kinase N-terminal 7TM domain-containing protein [Aquipuribacter hungaricus]|uniref:Histidine kinase N-terminal 7TM domain-containing protein n=1 Tax=Aquipuribacter hungaricus TaxID=545624 RepID=A0ABV7WJK5_9MICO
MAQVLAGLLVLAGVALAAQALWAARRRQVPEGRPLAAVLLAAAWWGLAGAVELSVTDPATRLLWGDLKYAGIVLVPPTWLVFVLVFTGRRSWVSRRTLALLAVEPLLVLGLLAVPDTHDLIRSVPPPTAADPVPVVRTGDLFWVHAVYAYGMVLWAMVVFIRGLLRTSRAYRRLSVALAVAAVLPWTANLLFNLEVGPFARVDLTPFLFVVTGAVVVLGLLQGRLLTLARVARDVVVDGLPDGVLVVDPLGRVLESNPAARALLGAAGGPGGGAHPEGVPVDVLLPDHAAGEVVVGGADGARTVEVRSRPLLDRSGTPAGQVLLLRDITARRAAEEQVRVLLEERTRVAAALQTALLPAVLPEVPGLLAGALYRPAGEGREIGGDFYELWPLGDGRWCAVLGDVAGKGAEAAAVTARVRFTLRALSADAARPERLLSAVNTALSDEGDDERFCTLAHVVLTPHPGGVSADLVLAGHLQPLLRRADGRVEVVGVPGTALGLVPDPVLVPQRVELADGDLLCLFTDGLVEARDAAGEELGTPRAADVLAAADPCGGGLGPTLAALEHAAQAWHGDPRLADDLAVLALLAAPGHGGSRPATTLRRRAEDRAVVGDCTAVGDRAVVGGPAVV